MKFFISLIVSFAFDRLLFCPNSKPKLENLSWISGCWQSGKKTLFDAERWS